MTCRFTALGSAVLCCGIASELVAQACIATPIANHQGSIGGSFRTVENVRTYAAELAYNLPGPVTVDAAAGISTFDRLPDARARNFRGRVAIELAASTVSLCPVIGVTYSPLKQRVESGELKSEVFVIPFGAGIGKSVQSTRNGFFLLHAMPHFMQIRTRPDRTIDRTVVTHEFGLDVGAGVHGRAAFGGLALSFTTIRGADLGLTATAGLIFSRRRSR